MSLIPALFLFIGVTAGEQPSQKKPETSFEKQFDHLKAEMNKIFESASQAAAEELEARRAANAPHARSAAMLKRTTVIQTKGNDFAKKAVALAQIHPGRLESFEVLFWLLGRFPDTAVSRDATDLLIKHHLALKRTERLINHFVYGPFDWVERLARAQAKAALPQDIKAWASMNLARIIQSKADLCDFAANSDAAGLKRLELMFGRSYLAKLRKIGAKHFREEALRHYRTICKDFNNVKVSKDGLTFKAWAEEKIRRMQTIVIGMPAPVTEGMDLKGKFLSLKQYRGRVVVLVFWASWCPPCMAEVPHLKKLTQRMKNKPFALVGVNADHKQETAEKVVREKGITWPSFFNTPTGPLTSIWAVDGYPTVIVIDHKGIIRSKQLRGELLDKKVEALIKEVKAERKPN